ncbi:protein transport protein Yif1p [[Candida] railenensis]|uniref:Protein YIF1 n=1 Tax=[Candida] railenensis TaxID=45579 RepID=A0A9P0QTM6_9ASCO|nr:protein transport protein Yif1p [[Candida] railenensis]
MYTPYQGQAQNANQNQYGSYGHPQQSQQPHQQQQYQASQPQQQYQQFGGGLQHPQPQHHAYPNQQPQQQHQHQQFQHGSDSSGGYGNFFSDPASAMAAQFAKNSFGQSNDYLQQNFGSLIPGTGDINYYFKVSNSYVLRKVGVILFPYRHKNWNRLTSSSDPSQQPSSSSTSSVQYVPPTHDLNAPDLYIPLMSFITYILLWASFQGFKGDFHPQLFGYLASQTLACSLIDITVFKVGLYLLNCSTQSSFWDIIAFSGYKYVTIIALLCWKNLIGGGWIYFGVVLLFTGNLSLFLMRSLKFFVLPIGSGVDHSASNSISSGQRRIRIQFLFVYAVVLQILLVLFMSR